jgi:hypothetical protein
MLKYLALLFLLFGCETTVGNLPEWKNYSREDSQPGGVPVAAGKSLQCEKKLASKGKLEGQQYSALLSRSGNSHYRIGATENRNLRYFGFLEGTQFWGELPDQDVYVRVGVKNTSGANLTLYNQKGEVVQTIEFSNCTLL